LEQWAAKNQGGTGNTRDGNAIVLTIEGRDKNTKEALDDALGEVEEEEEEEEEKEEEDENMADKGNKETKSAATATDEELLKERNKAKAAEPQKNEATFRKTLFRPRKVKEAVAPKAPEQKGPNAQAGEEARRLANDREAYVNMLEQRIVAAEKETLETRSTLKALSMSASK
jgi:hypothetical protein